MISLLLILSVKRQQPYFYSKQLLQHLYRPLRQDFKRTLVILYCFCAKPKLRRPFLCFLFLLKSRLIMGSVRSHVCEINTGIVTPNI